MFDKAAVMGSLRKHGLWPDAEARKNALIKEFRAAGLRRAEAQGKAWEQLELEYLPFSIPTVATRGNGDEAPDKLIRRLLDDDLLRLLQQHVALPYPDPYALHLSIADLLLKATTIPGIAMADFARWARDTKAFWSE